MRLHRFHGGLALPGKKEVAAADGLRRCALPAILRVPLLQHAGVAAVACVTAGDRVQRGQCVGRADDEFSAAVHAPAAGRVIAIERGELPQSPGVAVDHVVIETQVEASSSALPPLEWQQATPETLRARIREAGVVGLGGAGFPTGEKISADRDLLVLNGAECEPWIACDDALLRAHADEVVMGGRLLARIVGAAEVLLAIEDAMPSAIAAAREAAARFGEGTIVVVEVPTIYPQGGERQLIQTLTGREVPRGGLPRDIGVIVHNVATARAAWRAVTLGEPLLERIVTVTGRGIARPGNFVVPLGTAVSHLVAQAGGYTDDAARLLLGGSMMGRALPNDGFPIGKQHNCVLVLAADELPDARPEMPCIRCGDCASVCPSQLLPQQLLWHARGDRLDRATEQGLFDCIECGCCDLACPSVIPLTRQFREAKAQIRFRADESVRALAARDRHESRQQRLARESEQLAARQEVRKSEAARPDAVAAAVERARARRAAADEQDPPP